MMTTALHSMLEADDKADAPTDLAKPRSCWRPETGIRISGARTIGGCGSATLVEFLPTTGWNSVSTPAMKTDAEILAQIDAAFGIVERPEHFTDYRHCCECAEHDELLRSRDRETLRIADVGNPGWDPLCFAFPQGIAYYFPALARLALSSPICACEWYADQLLFHLSTGYRDNGFFQYCNPAQRAAVAGLLEHLIESRTDLVETHASTDELLRCWELWSVHVD